MENYKYYRKIVLTGDKSKYLFIKNYLSDNVKINMTLDELEQYDINIRYEDKGYIEKYDDKKFILIASNKIPMTKLISIPNNIFNIINSPKEIEKILVFSSFPYIKDDISYHLDQILSHVEVSDLLLILYKEKRAFGATDLSNEESSLKLAKKIYTEKNIDTLLFDEEKNNQNLFNINMNLINSFKQSYKNKYFNSLNRFLETYDSEYDLNIKTYFQMFCSLLDPEEYEKFNKLFSYEKNINSSDIWLSFVNSFESEYIMGSDGAFQILIDFYNNFISDISFWDLKTDAKVLEKLVINEYRLFFKNDKVLKAPKNELEYIKLMNSSEENSLEVLFKNRLDIFVNEKLRNVIRNSIQNCFDAIKIGEDEI